MRLFLHSNEFFSGMMYINYNMINYIRNPIRGHVNENAILILVLGSPLFPTGTRPRRFPQMGLSRLAVRNFDQSNGRQRLRCRHFPHARQLGSKWLASTPITSAAIRFLELRISRMARILGKESIGQLFQLDLDLSMGIGHGHAVRLRQSHWEGSPSYEWGSIEEINVRSKSELCGWEDENGGLDCFKLLFT